MQLPDLEETKDLPDLAALNQQMRDNNVPTFANGRYGLFLDKQAARELTIGIPIFSDRELSEVDRIAIKAAKASFRSRGRVEFVCFLGGFMLFS